MCRLVAYQGLPVLLETVLVKPENSIVMQSLHARETNTPTNGDGFGLGWYAPQIDPIPALFVSVFPAWSDRNLLDLTSKIISPCFFAHVRAASVGGINTYNCHPFRFNDWMLMHNGDIHDFISVKRHLRHLLDDDIYHWIQGETDSEHLFALFLQLSKDRDLTQLSTVADVMMETIYEINRLVAEFGQAGPSFFNVCLTDGCRTLAIRYCSYDNLEPDSLHYFLGNHQAANNHYQPENSTEKPDFALVSSERLTDFHKGWHKIPSNHMLLIDRNLDIEFRVI
jgi:glutamine amidotransferase